MDETELTTADKKVRPTRNNFVQFQLQETFLLSSCAVWAVGSLSAHSPRSTSNALPLSTSWTTQPPNHPHTNSDMSEKRVHPASPPPFALSNNGDSPTALLRYSTALYMYLLQRDGPFFGASDVVHEIKKSDEQFISNFFFVVNFLFSSTSFFNFL